MTKTAWLSALSLCLLAGCSKKGPECQAMVAVINPSADAMLKAGTRKGASPKEHAAEMRAMAKATKAASDNMSKVAVTVPELKKVQTDYQALYTQASNDANALADAIEAIAAAEAAMNKAGLELKTSLDAWGAACMTGKHPEEAAGCKAFADAVTSLPKDPTDKAGVDKSLAEMDKVTWKSDEFKAAAKKVRDAYDASTKQITVMKALGDKAEAADKSFGAIEPKEQALIDGFNTFCKD